MSVSVLFFWLLVGHAVADYPLQGDFLAKAKNHRAPLVGIPWQQALFWHSLMHAGAVALITGSVWAAGFELVVHICIDWLKCDGHTSFNQDQLLHILCKIGYAIILGSH